MMKFDFVTGNPPYHTNKGPKYGNNGTSTVYHEFVMDALAAAKNAVAMIIPSRWMQSGRNMDDFRKYMLTTKHIAVLSDYFMCQSVFPSVVIGGGVSWFILKPHVQYETTLILNDMDTSDQRPLTEFSSYARFNTGASVVRKINRMHDQFLDSMVYPVCKFHVKSNIHRSEGYSGSDGITCFTSNGKVHISRNSIDQNKEMLSQYKLVVSKVVYDQGLCSKTRKYHVFTKPVLLQPGEVCSMSYLVLAAEHDLSKIINIAKYINTIFVRFLVLNSLSSINLHRGAFSFVPMQDFTDHADIDWNACIPEIDQQLYDKYNLSRNEINFIESLITPSTETLLYDSDMRPILKNVQ